MVSPFINNFSFFKNLTIQQAVCPQECPFFCVTSANSFMLAAAPAANATGSGRRRQRRLRQFLRHERLTVARLLANRDHHTGPDRQTQARSGGEVRVARHGHDPEQPLSQRRNSSSCLWKSPAVHGHPVWVSRGSHRNVSSATPWSSSPTSCSWCRFWTFLCCRWWTNLWTLPSTSTSLCLSG